MKPRFSILTLLGVTAYIAVNLFAMTSPVRWRAEACFYVWLATLAGMAVGASQPVNTRVAFFRGFLYFAAIYTMGAFSFEGALPHAPIAELIERVSNHRKLDPYGPDWALTKLVFQNCVFASGLLGGSLAFWIYRRQERKAAKP